MMQVKLSQTGKRFGNRWVLRDLDLLIEPGQKQVIVGSNGSGKSTLLLMLAGFLGQSTGNIEWATDKQRIPAESLYLHISLASPALELVEEFTLEEMLRFHGQFKAFRNELTINKLIQSFGFQSVKETNIKQFSSGMKQRLKLLLAMNSESDLLLLDEPCTNLDAAGVEWYHQLLENCSGQTTIVIASNHKPEEYPAYDHLLSL